MEKFKRLNKRYFGISGYQFLFLGFLILSLFIFGDNSITKRIKYEREKQHLKSQIEFYRKQTEIDRAKLDELKSNKENLEKFARENYLMRKDGEEIFIIE